MPYAARTFLLDLAQFVEIAPTTTESLRQAGRLNLRDFEDAMQVAADHGLPAPT